MNWKRKLAGIGLILGGLLTMTLPKIAGIIILLIGTYKVVTKWRKEVLSMAIARCINPDSWCDTCELQLDCKKWMENELRNNENYV